MKKWNSQRKLQLKSCRPISRNTRPTIRSTRRDEGNTYFLIRKNSRRRYIPRMRGPKFSWRLAEPALATPCKNGLLTVTEDSRHLRQGRVGLGQVILRRFPADPVANFIESHALPFKTALQGTGMHRHGPCYRCAIAAISSQGATDCGFDTCRWRIAISSTNTAG